MIIMIIKPQEEGLAVILVDTSVLIDYIRGYSNSKVEVFKSILHQKHLTASQYIPILKRCKVQKMMENTTNLKLISRLKQFIVCQKI